MKLLQCIHYETVWTISSIFLLQNHVLNWSRGHYWVNLDFLYTKNNKNTPTYPNLAQNPETYFVNCRPPLCLTFRKLGFPPLGLTQHRIVSVMMMMMIIHGRAKTTSSNCTNSENWKLMLDIYIFHDVWNGHHFHFWLSTSDISTILTNYRLP